MAPVQPSGVCIKVDVQADEVAQAVAANQGCSAVRVLEQITGLLQRARRADAAGNPSEAQALYEELLRTRNSLAENKALGSFRASLHDVAKHAEERLRILSANLREGESTACSSSTAGSSSQPTPSSFRPTSASSGKASSRSSKSGYKNQSGRGQPKYPVAPPCGVVPTPPGSGDSSISAQSAKMINSSVAVGRRTPLQDLPPLQGQPNQALFGQPRGKISGPMGGGFRPSSSGSLPGASMRRSRSLADL
jgi:plasmid stabilization system protein ParE